MLTSTCPRNKSHLAALSALGCHPKVSVSIRRSQGEPVRESRHEHELRFNGHLNVCPMPGFELGVFNVGLQLCPPPSVGTYVMDSAPLDLCQGKHLSSMRRWQVTEHCNPPL